MSTQYPAELSFFIYSARNFKIENIEHLKISVQSSNNPYHNYYMDYNIIMMLFCCTFRECMDWSLERLIIVHPMGNAFATRYIPVVLKQSDNISIFAEFHKKLHIC